ncbi:MAG: ribosome-associated translation inhibitor RaiA [Thermotogae bacterium]|nr:ribosome-associated translation inhibitor RaiA [Thermotogota bacterium]
MDYNIVAKGFEMSNALRSYLDKRLSKLDRIVDNVVSMDVRLTREVKGREKVEITMHVGDKYIRVEEVSDDLYTSIDMAVDTLVKRVKKFKEMRKDRQKRAVKISSAVYEPQEKEKEETVGEIVRVKRFFLKPMNVDEAIDQMELLGHTFFVFRNAETDEINVVYKRKDGNYGLIEFE